MPVSAMGSWCVAGKEGPTLDDSGGIIGVFILGVVIRGSSPLSCGGADGLAGGLRSGRTNAWGWLRLRAMALHPPCMLSTVALQMCPVAGRLQSCPL